MSNRIRVLPDQLVNQIAAGEVVERPASIVKELVENAIDSGADRISVEVDAGGKKRIGVVDNGCGMHRDDALLSLERHATSKITSQDDLYTLRTLGFRGEAIPSISAVSRLVMETCPDADGEGTRIVVQGGRIDSVEPVGRDRGTTVTVTDLFRNTPARRKYLKASETEWRHILSAVTGSALANPDISFSLGHNGKRVLSLVKSDRQGRTEGLFRVRIGDDVVFVDHHGTDGMALYGHISTPERARSGGGHQFLTVNGRWVQHPALTYAIVDGFGGLIPKGASPAYGINLTVDPDVVDVNVHPTKREVRFSDPKRVYRFVADAIQSVLRTEELVPEWGTEGFAPIDLGSRDVDEEVDSHPLSSGYAPSRSSSGGRVADTSTEPAARYDTYLREPLTLDNRQGSLPLAVPVAEPEARSVAAPQAQPDGGGEARVPVWQLHRKYILAHVRLGMIVVDQHLAHVRVIYEKTLKHFSEAPATGQSLLFPQTLDLNLSEIVVVREAMPLMEQMGFGLRDFGGNSIVVDSVPAGLDDWEEGRVFRELVQALLETSSASLDLDDRTVSSVEHGLALAYAQTTAICHGQRMGVREMQAVVDQLFATSEPFVSPDGRPTLIRMPLEELDRRFRK